MEEVSIEKVHISLVSDIQTGPDRSKKTRLGLDRKKRHPENVLKERKKERKEMKKRGVKQMPLCSEHFFGKTYPLSGLTKLLPFSQLTQKREREREEKNI